MTEMTSGFDLSTRTMMRSNEANWDSRTPVHVSSAFYGLDGSRTAEDWFAPFEWEDLGDLRGLDVLHPQCHLGTETQAFAMRGARNTVGLDFSAEAVAHAERLTDESGLRIDYVHANVYDAVEALRGRTFDVIYTGKGSLCYLPDLRRWADVMANLLKPGGKLYVVEFHPVLNALGPVPAPGQGDELVLRNDYLAGRGAVERDASRTYTDGPEVTGTTVSYEWAHGLGEVVSSVVGAGLPVTSVRETELLPWPRWGSMERTESGWWRLPDSAPRIPLLYALRAVKPGG
ncbi:class I SAM-dependent methyltransferase [Parasphingorhabdus pacifica]